MADERENVRKIDLRVQDFFAALVTGDPTSLTEEISEGAVAKFCTGCDHLGADGVCKVVGSNDQARYAARDWCGWADVNGKGGEMTSKGFKG